MTTAARPHAARPRRALHIALWVAQVLLAAMFLMTGVMKLTQPLDALEIGRAHV